MADYVFGYGSLLDFSSRSQTEPTAQGLYPAKVSGYQRGWFHQFTFPSPITTFLGVEAHEPAMTNGIIYRVDNIKATDERENGYKRMPIYDHALTWYDPTNFSLPGKFPNEDAPDKLWIYVTKTANNKPVDQQHPVVQSYIDICVNGCFQADFVLGNLAAKPFDEIKNQIRGYNAKQLDDLFYGAISTYKVQTEDISKPPEPLKPKFAQDFLELTSKWPVSDPGPTPEPTYRPTYWENDRIHPRRPFEVKNALRIDELLDSKWPGIVARIKI